MVTGFEFDGCQIFKALVGSDMVVVAAPGFYHGFGLGAGAKSFHGKALIAELTVKALVGAVLPGFARIDVRGRNGFSGEPFENGLTDEFGAIVRTQMGRCAVNADQFGKDFNDALGADRAGNIDGEAFAGELIDHGEAFNLLAIGAGVEHEIVGPDVIRGGCGQRARARSG